MGSENEKKFSIYLGYFIAFGNINYRCILPGHRFNSTNMADGMVYVANARAGNNYHTFAGLLHIPALKKKKPDT